MNKLVMEIIVQGLNNDLKLRVSYLVILFLTAYSHVMLTYAFILIR